MDINNEVRLEVLQMTLVLEDMLNRILIQLFRIKKDTPNTFSHKSSSISFKTKVDFLFDLERIDKKTYNDLITLMEIRNQFMHNLSAESYLIVLNRLGKEKYIENFASDLRSSNSTNEVPTENELIYKYGVNRLYLQISNKLTEVVDTINKEIEEEKRNLLNHEIYEIAVKLYDESLDEFAKEFSDLWRKKMGGKEDIGKLISQAIKKRLKKKLEDKYQIKLDLKKPKK